jgi:hypothetical protein
VKWGIFEKGFGMKMVSIGRQAGLTLVLAGLVVSLTGCGGSFDNDVSGATSPSAVNAVGLEFTRTPQPETGVTPGPVIQPAPGLEGEPTPEPGAEPGPVTEPTPGPVVTDPAGGETEGEPIPIIEPGFDGRLPPPGNLLRTPATCEALRDFFEPKYQSGAFQTIITNEAMPDYTPVRLRTDSWISYIPEIPNLYPGQEMVVVMSPGPIDYSVCPPVLPIRMEWFADFRGLWTPLFINSGNLELKPDRPYHPDFPYFYLERKGDWKLEETFVGEFDFQYRLQSTYSGLFVDFYVCHSRPRR